jgi:hypothetical protein
MLEELKRHRGPSVAEGAVPALAAEPIAWLAVAVAGLALIPIGIGIDSYRHEHGAGAAELISFDSPGVIVAIGGLALVAVGVLVAASILLLREAPSAEEVIRRGAAIAAACVAVAVAGAGALTYAATSDITIGHGGHESRQASPDDGLTGGTTVPGEDARVTLRGELSLDGAPLNAEFIGARVIRDRLPAACQGNIPAAVDGRYEITVVADEEVRGCGADGSEILLWTFVDGQYLFARELVGWPGDGETLTFDATFSRRNADGASSPVTEFKGELLDRAGRHLPGGTVLEAYAGDTLCGVTSMRYGNVTEQLYTLIVAGPDLVPACSEGARLTFRIDGEPASETAVNDLGRGSAGHELNLTVR